ncbi:MAG: tRNA uridine-5-carboxymethylaminomethyl(34) synthesis GTPase MnmE [Pseudomonadota bacterium]
MEPAADTIFALSTARARSGVAVIRISGSLAHAAVRRGVGQMPPPRVSALRWLRDEEGSALDQVLMICFEEGASFTGEAAVELHCHGSVAVTDAVLAWLQRTPGLRLAEPGEFTRRSLEAGRTGLLEIEALGELLAAETDAQRRRAIKGLEGGFERRAEQWRQSLVRALALVEVTMDWADEEVPEDVSPEVAALIASVAAEIGQELEHYVAADRLRHGHEIAILGPPNVGKSTLLNAVAGREAAITAPVPGTTRDIVEIRCELDGAIVRFLDTAGLRHSTDEVERIGVDRARARAANATLRLFLRPDSASLELFRDGDLVIWSMSDLGSGPGDLAVSALTGDGISELLAEVARRLGRHREQLGLAGTPRQAAVLEGMKRTLASAESAIPIGAELVAEELRNALGGLGNLVGATSTEDVLGEVFSNFCLGK